MATKLGSSPDPLPLNELGFGLAFIPLPLDSISSRSGCFSIPEGGIGKVVSQNRGPGNPLGPSPNALVDLVPFLHGASLDPMLSDGHLRLHVDCTVAANVRQGKGFPIADVEGPSLFVFLMCWHPYQVRGGIIVECIQDQGIHSGKFGLRRAGFLPAG